MQLYSTGDKATRTDFKTAVKLGLAPDGGLYMPERLPHLPVSFWKELKNEDIAGKASIIFELLLKEDFSREQQLEIVERAFTFDAPLVPLDDNAHILELFHGPTLAFKDFGARTMAAMLSVIAREEGEKITIVTATSGDTGAAVAHGFHNAPGVEVFVLYPAGQVSSLQEKQFTTLGDNITALEVDGTFDDCQRLVKACFADEEIRTGKQLTTANSINIARLLPQMIYYIHGVSEMLPADDELPSIICSVPCGNFGNLTAGLLARNMGLPISRFVAATNINHVVPDYLQKGRFQPRASIRTISNAMDVGNPSNFDRMLDMYDHDHEAMAVDVKGAWFDDELTGETIVDVWNRHQYVMDPHTAVGYSGYTRYGKKDDLGLILATAHPAKFHDIIERLIPGQPEIPDRLAHIAELEKKSIPVPAEISAVKEYLLK